MILSNLLYLKNVMVPNLAEIFHMKFRIDISSDMQVNML